MRVARCAVYYASVESSMSSVKGFSGPASEKIKLFIIGHRRRSAFLMNAWTLAGTLRSVMLYWCWAMLATVENGSTTPKEMGSAVGPLHSAPQRRLRLACGWCDRQISAKVELGVTLVCYLTLAAAFGLFAFLEWIGAE